MMRRVTSRDTLPELIVRRIAHSLGYRFRLHAKYLPGKPDLTFAGRRRVIFVHGCFWHGHNCPRGARLPKSNTAYWQQKIGRNELRDADVQRKLGAEGWRVLVIWECQLRDMAALKDRLTKFLGTRSSRSK